MAYLGSRNWLSQKEIEVVDTSDVTRSVFTSYRRCQADAVLGDKFPELGSHIKDEDGTLRKFINVYVNDEDIRFLGGDTYQFQDRDEVMFIPSIAGGNQ